MVSQRCFFLEPKEKSHGQADEATLPLCVMVRKLHVFPSEKGKKHQFCLPRKWEIHLQESPRFDLKNRHIKKTKFSKFFPRSSELFPPIPKGSKAPGEFPSKRLCDLGSSPIHLGSCNFGERISWNPRCFFGVLLCDGTWNACQKA